MRSNNLSAAEKILDRAVSLHPTAVEAWMSLAGVQEQLRDWDSAYSTWSALSKLTNESNVEELASASLLRVNDERVISGIAEAEELAALGHFDSSLAMLLDSAALKPSPRTMDRTRRRYFEILGQWFGKEINSAVKASGWTSLAVANFAGGSEVEGYSIRDHIYSALQEASAGKPRMVHLSENTVRRLQDGDLGRASDRDRELIQRTGADAVVFGILGKELSSYVYDVRAQETRPLLSVGTFGEIPGYPSNVEGWALLPTKRATSQGLSLEMWTDKER